MLPSAFTANRSASLRHMTHKHNDKMTTRKSIVSPLCLCSAAPAITDRQNQTAQVVRYVPLTPVGDQRRKTTQLFTVTCDNSLKYKNMNLCFENGESQISAVMYNVDICLSDSVCQIYVISGFYFITFMRLLADNVFRSNFRHTAIVLYHKSVTSDMHTVKGNEGKTNEHLI